MNNDIITMLKMIGKNACSAKGELSKLQASQKDKLLLLVADMLIEYASEIIKANEKDIEIANGNGMSKALIDRLKLDLERIKGMSEGLVQIAALDNPIGEFLSMKNRPNGLRIGQKRVPLGVIGIIYEARPNVTADAFGLCFKTGNAVILKGGSDAINSNIAITNVIRKALDALNIDQNAIQLIENTDRAVTIEFMKLNEYIDVLIPRGSAALINAVVENSKIPVIETGTGNCHVFVDATADFNMALDIIENGKTQRIGVCNAVESLLVDEQVAKEFLPKLAERLKKHNVEIRADKKSCEIVDSFIFANEEDYYTEYLDYIVSLKIVQSIDEAISHINEHGTGHSEAIITSNYENSQKFLDEIDAAAVYVNASTRFTDGFEFGFGAEIGISTQKLHARGPMGLNELTSTKYIIYGNGQVR